MRRGGPSEGVVLETLLSAALGALAGAVLGWLAGTWRTRAPLLQSDVALREKLSALASTVDALRGQLDEAGQALEKARAEAALHQSARAAAEARLDESAKALEAQRQLLANAEAAFKDAFTALSTQVLRGNSEEFARQVSEKVRPLSEALGRYEAELKRIESARQEAYGGLDKRVRDLAVRSDDVAQQARSLATALRSPTVKGRWGELALQRAVEAAGLSARCDFELQASVTTDTGRQRPDMVVHLPGGRRLVVDAKTPTSDYLAAVEAGTEEQRVACLERHARATRLHLQNLSGKAYWSQFERTPEFVVMYVPGEAFFAAALERDPTLIEDGIRDRVVPASPTTFIALLRGVAAGWKEHDTAENAHRIREVARELYERICNFVEHLARVGDGLARANEAYNSAVGSWERRVRPMSNRVNELGVGSDGTSTSLKAVDAGLRIPAIESQSELFPRDAG